MKGAGHILGCARVSTAGQSIGRGIQDDLDRIAAIVEPEDAPIREALHVVVPQKGPRADVCKKIDFGWYAIRAVDRGARAVDDHQALQALLVHGEPRLESAIPFIPPKAGAVDVGSQDVQQREHDLVCFAGEWVECGIRTRSDEPFDAVAEGEKYH
ncbi:hypothetical protein ACX80J_07035 [Arthrobacter sp. MDB2-24]